MEQNQNPIRPEAATDEPASPVDPAGAPADAGKACSFATPAEDEAYWKGVGDGLQCAGSPWLC